MEITMKLAEYEELIKIKEATADFREGKIELHNIKCQIADREKQLEKLIKEIEDNEGKIRVVKNNISLFGIKTRTEWITEDEAIKKMVNFKTDNKLRLAVKAEIKDLSKKELITFWRSLK